MDGYVNSAIRHRLPVSSASPPNDRRLVRRDPYPPSGKEPVLPRGPAQERANGATRRPQPRLPRPPLHGMTSGSAPAAAFARPPVVLAPWRHRPVDTGESAGFAGHGGPTRYAP